MNYMQVGGRVVLRHDTMIGKDINIIGCGGIGARILPALTRMLSAPTSIYLWDDDTVEVKNLLRQNFALPDVGKPKAEVLAQRYSTALARCQARTERWSDYNHGMPEGMVISAVDDWATRRALMTQRYGPVIDCGNDGMRGQVLLGGAINRIPFTTIDSFPELIVEQPPQPCDLGDTQTVLANTMAATLALNYAQCLIYGLPFSHVGMMFSLPHGVWEIPAAALEERWKGHNVSTMLRVYPNWSKSTAGQWSPAMSPGGDVVKVDITTDGPGGWPQSVIDLVENALYGCGAERQCACDHCVGRLIVALEGLQLTEMPEPLRGGWGMVEVAKKPTTNGGGQHFRRRPLSYECENCGDTFTPEEARENDSHDITRWCGETCSVEYLDNHSDDEEDVDPEPEPDPDEDEAVEVVDPTEEERG
jgi:molybdopterin/thiamine biosynthesis adenylyltransferase